MAVTNQELETMLAELDRLQQQRQPPEPPKVFATIEEAYAFADTLLKTSMPSLPQDIEQLRRSIIEALPINGVWVKVGKWVIGKYREAQGDRHYELAIRRDGEELYPLTEVMLHIWHT